jgi:hypothetical protein
MRRGLIVRDQRDAEIRFLKSEITQMRGDTRGELRRRGLPFRAQLCA